MLEFIAQYATLLKYLALFSGLLLLISIFLLPFFINYLPADYFSRREYHSCDSIFRAPIRNMLGLLVIGAGILMLVLPGQGIACIILGIVMMKFPGKYRVIRKIVSYPSILHSLNWVRKRGDKPLFDITAEAE